MPPRPRAPRSRVSTIRRPRVAGLAPAAHRAEGADLAETGLSPDTHTGPHDARTADARTADATTADATTADATTADATTEASTVDVPAAESPTATVSTVKTPAVAAPAVIEPTEPAEAPTVERARPRPADKSNATRPTALLPTGPDAAQPGRFRGPAVPLLAVALVLLTALAVFFGIADARLRGTPSASNAALVDVGATAEAAGQLTDALETVYSYDFARLDENERAARAVITPEFGVDFDKLFSQVRELAPQRQAVVSATVQLSAIQNIEGDRAVLVAFMDQRATTAAQGAAAQQLAASGRLTVTGERVDGRWKIAGVESR